MDIKVKQEYLEKAAALHQSCPVVDAHLDLAGEILLRRQLGEKNIIREHYLKPFQKAGLRLVLSSVYVETANLKDGWENALMQIRALKEETEKEQKLMLVKDVRDLEELLAGDRIGLLLYMEGLDCIGEEAGRLEELYEMGVRGASLTWSRQNALGFGCCKASEHKQIPGGLTAAGVRAVQKLEELSMFLDVSHLNDQGFAQVCQITERSFLATHSGSRTVYDSYRNLTDEQMGALAAQGGVMGMNGCKYIAGSLSGNHLEMLCRHIEYEAEQIGEAHVGFGFDLCDSYDRARAALRGKTYTDHDDCFWDHGQIPLLTAALLQRGMSREGAIGMIGGNMLRYFRSVLPPG